MTNENHAENGSGESGKDDKKSGFNEKDYVPKSQFTAALNNQEQKHKQEIEALRAELKEKAPAEDSKDLTRKELREMVENGELTQDQADTHWDLQHEKKLLAKVGHVAKSTVDSTTRDQNVLRDIDRYAAADPEVKEEGTAIREKIKAEFLKLVELGDDPRSFTTELKALRMACGDINAFELARSGKDIHEHDEQDGGNNDGGGGKKHKDFKSSLNPRLRKHYQKQIDNGIYKNWDAVKEEMTEYQGKKVA